ncbi:MAG: hypothetical protein RSE13_07890 [Planktothrix sp. GU0601_MAG3]|nr:MAG: hypothetical protein RSE13_07890 [Planktothrix sp. GU0601_MAG3]
MIGLSMPLAQIKSHKADKNPKYQPKSQKSPPIEPHSEILKFRPSRATLDKKQKM